MILHGDCLEELKKLPDNSVDSVVTDPPYCSGGFTEAGKKNANGQGLRSETRKNMGWFSNDNMTTLGLDWLLRNVMIEVNRVLKDGSSALVFTDWRMYSHLAPSLESSGMRLQNMIIWDKGSMGMGTGFRPRHEVIMHFVKGKGVYYSKKVGNVLSYSRVYHKKKNHPTEKPTELLTELIQTVTPPNGVVLDPFAGSGSTLLAAKQAGFNYIGIEKEAKYIEIIKQRIS